MYFCIRFYAAMVMKRTLYTLLFLLSASMVFTSCMKSDDDTTANLNDECYISSFSLGQLKRVLHTKDSNGQDSIYRVSISGSLYKMIIDQREQVITNLDSLPTNTSLSAALVTLTYKGTVSYAQLPDTSEWKNFSTTDSIDLSRPLIFRVTAENPRSFRDYVVKVNVHQAEPTAYTWSHVSDVRSLMGTDDSYRLFFVDDRAVLLSSDVQGGQVYAATSTMTDPAPAWIEQTCTGLPAGTSVATAQYFADKFWLLYSGVLYASTDAVAWEEVTPEPGTQLLQLVAASSSALYASFQDEAGQAGMASSTDGVKWEIQSMETTGFTGKSPAAVSYCQKNGNSRVLMAENVADEAGPLTVWSLLEGTEEPWIIFAQPGDNNYLLPAQQHLNIICYDDKLVALGGQHLGRDTNSALSVCYVSYDNGITWKVDGNLIPPTSLRGSTGPVSAAAEGEYIWLVAAGQVWCARLNGFGE